MIEPKTKPSDRYFELLELYKQMHVEGDKLSNIPSARTFPGHSLLPHAERVRKLIDTHGIKEVLDYGAGKGLQYSNRIKCNKTGATYRGVAEYWGIPVTCYDPAYAAHSELPDRMFDAVICTDVLEHCPEEDIPWIVDELFCHARKLVYANIACFPALKSLPTGENAHVTVRPMTWWEGLVNRVAKRYPDVAYLFLVTIRRSLDGGEEKYEEKYETSYFGCGHGEIDLSDGGITLWKEPTRKTKLKTWLTDLLA